MSTFRRIQKCRRCGKEYEWFGYKLRNGEIYAGPMPYHFSDAFQDFAGNWGVMVNCEHCGHREEAENFSIG